MSDDAKAVDLLRGHRDPLLDHPAGLHGQHDLATLDLRERRDDIGGELRSLGIDHGRSDFARRALTGYDGGDQSLTLLDTDGMRLGDALDRSDIGLHRGDLRLHLRDLRVGRLRRGDDASQCDRTNGGLRHAINGKAHRDGGDAGGDGLRPAADAEAAQGTTVMKDKVPRDEPRPEPRDLASGIFRGERDGNLGH